MQIRVGFEMEYQCPGPTPMILALNIHYTRASDLVRPPYGTMDFAAWFEAFLDDRWYTFDARNNTPRIGRVLIARGRDACDVALASTFGPNTLERFKVWTDEVAAP
jgi:transglutaminase-like putative cysteine protease